MGIITRFNEWTSSHNPKWLALIRVALGVTLLMRGIAFLNHPTAFTDLMIHSRLPITNPIIISAIPWVHIVGGFLLIIGFITRVAVIIQFPVILGFIAFVAPQSGAFSIETNIILAIFIFLLLIVFLIEGGGPLSIATYLKEE